ncbi:methyl-accepting chemotaxis protein [Aquabacterium sp.]|uniref:methyl-accepting chemotaxis protein n=1 Tax=Aquabacterium sp. TaxID=1872578 RepID=UPI0025C04CD0|nr:methyl-accepting chemotaxis protein [Aquabacterium sp.]
MSTWITNLPLRFKFLLLTAVALVMAGAPALIVLSEKVTSLRGLEEERGGMPPTEASLHLIKLMQEHRGLSTAFLSGDASKLADMKDRAAKVQTALADTRQAILGLDSEPTNKTIQGVTQEWEALSKDVGSGVLTPPVSVKRHTELIARTLLLLEDIAAVSGLALDADAESYFLIMSTIRDVPRLTEKLGIARARGTAMLVKNSSTPEERQTLSNLLTAAKTHAQDAQRNLDRALDAGSHDVAYQKEAVAKAEAAVQRGVELVSSLALNENLPDMKGADYFKAMTEVITAQFELNQSSLRRLEERFVARKAAEVRALGLTATVILLMGALGAWLSITITRSTTRTVSEAVAVAEALARGDLTQRIRSHSRDEIGRMVDTMGAAIGHLQNTIIEIKAASDSVATASSQIAQGNLDLSARTESQASSLQQTASSMEEMSATVNQNAGTAQQAHTLANQASAEAAQGGEAFAKVVAKMGEIKQTSSKIADINAVIDGIAFQTNILALNAAVEAARAGEQGRGFAVVASEVRTLAQRSANAAKEIKSLIHSSVESVEEGYVLASDSGESIERLVGQVQKVTALMSEIALSSEQQSLGIAQVNQAVTQLDQTTQQNAALVEESSAAASSLSDQARRLQDAVSRFHL